MTEMKASAAPRMYTLVYLSLDQQTNKADAEILGIQPSFLGKKPSTSCTELGSGILGY